jgi:hypothetical protein
MEVIRYCTPEWLSESARLYRENPKFQQELSKVTTKVFYRITAEPAWGLDQDILFGAIVEKGILHELKFFSFQEAKQIAEFILSATPQEWKKILRKENKFVTDFLLGKIALEQGSKVGVLGIAPYANHFINALTQFELKFQDELSPEEVEEYRSYANDFRARLGV